MKLATKQDNFRLWQEPAPRKLQQCIMQLRSDAAERERATQAGLIWVPVLNHRLNGQVKGTDLDFRVQHSSFPQVSLSTANSTASATK